MPELIVPSHIAEARRAQLAQTEVPTSPHLAGTVPVLKQRGRGLGKAVHKIDPALKIYEQLGIPVLRSGKNKGQPVQPNLIPGYHVAGNRVVIAVYERPESIEVAGGYQLYISDQTRREDEHQGKAGLIIAMGHAAFKTDAQYDFGDDAKVFTPGTWVAIHVSDGRKIVINGQLCRLVEDQYISLKIPAPDAVY